MGESPCETGLEFSLLGMSTQNASDTDDFPRHVYGALVKCPHLQFWVNFGASQDERALEGLEQVQERERSWEGAEEFLRELERGSGRPL